MSSCITDSGFAREDSTSPTTLPKSNDSSASNLRASCCMRRLSARQAMCSSRKPRLRAASKRAAQQRRADAVTLPRLLHADRRFRLARKAHAELPQLGGATHHAVKEKTVHDGFERDRQINEAADEIVGYAAAEPVMPACGIEPQQMVAVTCRLRRSTICGSRRLREERPAFQGSPDLVVKQPPDRVLRLTI